MNKVRQRLFKRNNLSEMVLNQEYCFRLKVHPDQYALTVWNPASAEPRPQIVVDDPEEKLRFGAPGIIAFNAAIRLYDFHVRPLD
jgi:hypothetical protein